MKRSKNEKPGYARLLDAWTPPPDVSEAAKEGAIMAGQKGPVVRLRNGLGHAQ